jgi:hypothetical protein
MKKFRRLETIHEDEELSVFEPTYGVQNFLTFFIWFEQIFPCLFAGQGDICGFRV